MIPCASQRARDHGPEPSGPNGKIPRDAPFEGVALYSTALRGLKQGSMWLARRGPAPSAMSLNDRAADRQAHPRAARFGGVKGLEKPFDALGFNPGPESRTETRNPGSVFAVLISNSRGPSLIPLIASMALMSKLIIRLVRRADGRDLQSVAGVS